MRIAGMLPVVFVLCIMAGAYFSAVVVTLLPQLEEFPIASVVKLVVFHFVELNALINLLLCVFTDPGSLPAAWCIPAGAEGSAELPPGWENTWERSYSGARRYCRKCRGYKPDRTHHCSQCGRCVLRMDHHCVFVNNCVGFYNYKFFLGFLFYAWIGCCLVTFLAGQNFANVVKTGVLTPSSHSPLHRDLRMQTTRVEIASQAHIDAVREISRAGRRLHRTLEGEIIMSIIDKAQKKKPGSSIMNVKEVWFVMSYVIVSAFSFALTFFNAFHLYLALNNKTTIEQYESVDGLRLARIQRYNLGRLGNCKSHCGMLLWTWPLPIRYSIPGNGVIYDSGDAGQLLVHGVV